MKIRYKESRQRAKKKKILRHLEIFYQIRVNEKWKRSAQSFMGRVLAPDKGVRYEECMVNGLPCFWTQPEENCVNGPVILYCHGGGYTTGDIYYSRILSGKISKTTGMKVFAFAYPLAPEYTYPVQLNSAVQVYTHLLNTGYKQIIVAGESAGGHLALSLTAKLRENKIKLPLGLICMSPWTDLTMSGDSYTSKVEEDPMITREYIMDIRRKFAPGGDYANPYISPLHSSFDGYPPTLIQVGSRELLLDDAIGLYQKMCKAGIQVSLHIFKNMWHVFQLYPEALVQEVKTALDEMGKFICEVTA